MLDNCWISLTKAKFQLSYDADAEVDLHIEADKWIEQELMSPEGT